MSARLYRVVRGVAQPLYRLQNKIQYDQAKVQVAQADAQLSLALQDLILRVAQAYFDILLAQVERQRARQVRRELGPALMQVGGAAAEVRLQAV